MRGKNVILVFYPADDTSVCTKQVCEFRDRWADVQSQKRCGVRGESGARPRRIEKFRDKFNIPFPLLVDEGQKIAKLYQADGWFVPKRTVYLIGPDGIIRFARRGKPSPEEVLAAAL